MKIHFKTLEYQTKAVDAVVSCFKGQSKQELSILNDKTNDLLDIVYYANCPLKISEQQILSNIQKVQKQNGLKISNELDTNDYQGKNLTGSPLNISVEMETGTGKTYVFIRTIFELNKLDGWSKFIIVVPSIAIREGIYKSLQMTNDHFMMDYHKKAKYFIYDSKNLNNIQSFSSDHDINIMIINIQAFNSKGENNRRIYEELDKLQSRKPIDIIKKNNPILILDEPQKMGAEKTLESLANFNPLFILRFSATHKHPYNLVYKLDAIDSFNERLVKKIIVTGIEIETGLQGIHGYLYLHDIIISKSAPEAILEIEVKYKNGNIKREIRKVKKSDNLYKLSGNLSQYKDRFIITEINDNSCYFENGLECSIGQIIGAPDEQSIREIQIREAIKAHIEKEKQLFELGIKVLSLFFIDEVAKYRKYDDKNNIINGEYVKIFEEQYKNIIDKELQNIQNDPYKKYLSSIQPKKTHKGYFSIDKNNKMINPIKKSESDSIKDYDLILKDKEKLLSFDEPTRFIFSHSALKEGWDNPNVFVICTLKNSDNNISRRQEIGRGLRLAVNKDGQRMDINYFNGNLSEIHKINTLNVIVNESYKSFVAGLQSEILETITRVQKITLEFLKDIKLNNEAKITDRQVNTIYNYLINNNYIDENGCLTDKFQQAVKECNLPVLEDDKLQAFAKQIFQHIKSCLDPNFINKMVDDANNKVPNKIVEDNLNKKEFQNLWKRINKIATFEINIDTNELISKCIDKINQISFNEKLTYKIEDGEQTEFIDRSNLENQTSFPVSKTYKEQVLITNKSNTKFDLLGEVANATDLTRKTIANILTKIEKFDQYKSHPEYFIKEVIKLINEQKNLLILSNLKYNILDKELELNKIFIISDVCKNSSDFKKSIYKKIIFDSNIEKDFADELEKSTDVVVYTKLPKTFNIPTPFGSYTPDWAIVFDKIKVKYIYFIVETKGDDNINNLSTLEQNKIKSAEKYFENINLNIKDIKYKIVKDYSKLYKDLEKNA